MRARRAMWPPRCWTPWSTDIDPERPPETLSAGPAEAADTLRRKRFPFDKVCKISLYFNRQIKCNEVNDKSEIMEIVYEH